MPDTTAPLPRLVVVEDDDSIRELLAAGLRFAGYDVGTTASGGEAVGLIVERQPNLVVLDVNLPDVDGFEVSAGFGPQATRYRLFS